MCDSDISINYKTTSDDFNIFKNKCGQLVNRFGLHDWSIYYQHANNLEGCKGSCEANITGMVATITLNVDWADNIISPEEIEQTATYEVLELLVAPMRAMAGSRCVTIDEIENHAHALIRRLQNTILAKRVLMRDELGCIIGVKVISTDAKIC